MCLTLVGVWIVKRRIKKIRQALAQIFTGALRKLKKMFFKAWVIKVMPYRRSRKEVIVKKSLEISRTVIPAKAREPDRENNTKKRDYKRSRE